MMKKILIVIFFMFELCSLVACSNRPKTEMLLLMLSRKNLLMKTKLSKFRLLLMESH